MIIDHLHEDEKTLRSCSLTCSAWVPRTRYHLFNSIVFNSRLGLGSLQAWIRVFPELSKSPATYVQSLKLNSDESALIFPLPEGNELEHFRSFRNVSKLTLNNVSFVSFREEHIEQFTTTVRSLVLSRCKEFGHADLLRVVFLFPDLDNLTVGGLSGSSTPKDFVHSRTSPNFQGHLNLSGFRDLQGIVIRGLLESPGGVKFRSVVMDCGRKQEFGEFSLLLGRCASTLKSLLINCSLPSKL